MIQSLMLLLFLSPPTVTAGNFQQLEIAGNMVLRCSTRCAANTPTVLFLDAQVTILAGGEYNFDSTAARLTVLEGRAAILTRNGRTEIQKGQAVSLHAGIHVDSIRPLIVRF